MDIKTAIVLHTLGVSLIASGVSYKWSVEGFIFSVLGGVMCAVCLDALFKIKGK